MGNGSWGRRLPWIKQKIDRGKLDISCCNNIRASKRL
jgi:hypothetical protein